MNANVLPDPVTAHALIFDFNIYSFRLKLNLNYLPQMSLPIKAVGMAADLKIIFIRLKLRLIFIVFEKYI